MDGIQEYCAGLYIRGQIVTAVIPFHGLEPEPIIDNRIFETTNAGMLSLTDWLIWNSIAVVALVGKGDIWLQAYQILESSFEVLPVSPDDLKIMPSEATDEKEALWVSELLRYNLLFSDIKLSIPQPEMRNILQVRAQNVKEKSVLVHRVREILENSGIEGPYIGWFMDPKVTGINLIETLSENAKWLLENVDLKRLGTGQVGEKKDQILNALGNPRNNQNGSNLVDIICQIDNLDWQILRLDERLLKMTSADNEVTIKVSDSSGSKVVTAKVPSNVPMKRLLPALIKKIGFPDGQYEAFHKRLGRNLADDDTLIGAEVLEDDILRVMPVVVAGGWLPVRSFRDIQLVEAVLNNRLVRSHGQDPLVFCVFLYTDQDQLLASYIRANIQELGVMAGPFCLFFTIEQPAQEWKEKIRVDLGELTGNYLDTIWNRLGTDTFKPFDKSQAIIIGRRFGIEPNQFPCIVFFTNLKSKKQMIVEIKDYVDSKAQDLKYEYSRFFRELFTATQGSMDLPEDERLSQIGKLIRAQWHQTIKKHAKPIEPTEIAVPVIEVIGALVKLFTK